MMIVFVPSIAVLIAIVIVTDDIPGTFVPTVAAPVLIVAGVVFVHVSLLHVCVLIVVNSKGNGV